MEPKHEAFLKEMAKIPKVKLCDLNMHHEVKQRLRLDMVFLVTDENDIIFAQSNNEQLKSAVYYDIVTGEILPEGFVGETQPVIVDTVTQHITTLKELEDFVVGSFWGSEGINFCCLGLVGEAGEVADEWKKFLRDDGGHINGSNLGAERRKKILFEITDTLFYLVALAKTLGCSLEQLVELFQEKAQISNMKQLKRLAERRKDV